MIRPLLFAFVALAAACASTDPAPVDPAPVEAGPSEPTRSESAQPESAPATAAEAARAANDAAYAREGARLADEAKGKWILIARGDVKGPFPTFDDAWSEAGRSALDTPHAYLYRAGVDDVDVTFVLSPFLSSAPCWTQMGRRLRAPFRLTIAAVNDTWSRRVGGEVKSVSWGDRRARFVLTGPDRATEVQSRGVASGLFEDDLSITADIADRLGLGRFEAPGAAYYADERWPCRKLVARLAIPELGIDAPAVAYVLPRELTDTGF